MERSRGDRGDRTNSDWRQNRSAPNTKSSEDGWSTVQRKGQSRGSNSNNWKDRRGGQPQQNAPQRGHHHHRNPQHGKNSGHGSGVSEAFLQYDLDEATYEKLSTVIQELYMDGPQLSIPRDTLCSLVDVYGVEAVGHTLSRMVVDLEFPYKRYFISDIHEKFQKLRNYRASFHYDKPYFIPVLDLKTKMLTPFHYKGRFTLMPSEVEDYEDMNILIDYFQEPARISSVAGYDTASTLQHWGSPELNKLWLYPLLVQQCSPNFNPAHPREDGINSYTLREAMYPVVKSECTSFKATVASAVIRMFEAKRVLDFCAGWGDRLLGALATQEQLESYTGVDPNTDLFSAYDNMIRTFSANEEVAQHYKMINAPFESCQLPEKATYDLIFTGPPYYDYEKYGTTGQNQSISTYPEYADWLVQFLFFSIEKSWERLEDGGHLALNFSDVRQLVAKNVTITEVTNLWIQYKLKDAVYDGVLCFTGANKPLPRPIWVYQKLSQSSEANEERSKEALSNIKEHYPKVYEAIQKKEGF